MVRLLSLLLLLILLILLLVLFVLRLGLVRGVDWAVVSGVEQAGRGSDLVGEAKCLWLL